MLVNQGTFCSVNRHPNYEPDFVRTRKERKPEEPEEKEKKRIGLESCY